ncbi:DUF885 domain-containing protein [Porticoccus sp. W117]|uniref:DUF885 domain-containing protein n=1 Tax=Porticoccus sp. W117 TaxID=3054777 RepID=UPI0025963E55|nr:DUF885 domain-containing protein [Porticoccus sp. W117]MDM3872180.1 DUF885 domain-containing protein [Porticoccus sp. W117]
MKLLPAALLSFSALLITACSDPAANNPELASKNVNQLLDKQYDIRLQMSPIGLTAQGKTERYHEWDDISGKGEERQQALRLQHLNELNAVETGNLNKQTRLSLQLAKDGLQQEIDSYRWRHHDYPLSQMGGIHTTVADVLINQHKIANAADAEAYISRLGRTQTLFDQMVQQLRTRQAKGVMPPAFVLQQVVDASLNVITGAPFDDGPDSPLLADFRNKVNALDIDTASKEDLIERASNTLKNVTFRAYSKLIAFVSAMQRSADERAGIWKLPEGDAYYAHLLKLYTTTDMSADEIHELGLAEVKRIHSEMDKIRQQVGFEGDLQAFFEFFRTDPQFFYPNTDVGRAGFLKRSEDAIAAMKERLPEQFGILPKADLVVKAVEPYREASAGIAFYERPALDGSRPGIYYTNLYDMNAMPNYQIDATAFHEAVPGHHMQIAIAQELTDLPEFRKFGGNTAYVEGWALYTELLAKEMGFYQDPYSDFGRLTLELMRAIRLVVDTGMHSKQWTREQAIQWFLDNGPNPKEEVVKEIERYMVIPGQATSYKIGMLKILELRENAKAELGDKFDIRSFHDLILGNGPLPLTVLEQQVNEWVAEQKG